jgi:hypothetical protein
MAVSRALRRLLNIRNIEEEQSRMALESARSELQRLEHALAATAERNRFGRRLVQTSARTGELPDRLAGIEDTNTANRHAAALAPRIADAELDVVVLRDEFLLRRVERRQAETLIQESAARDDVDAARRGQQGLDDWYGNRLHRSESEAERASQPIPGGVRGKQ